MAPELVLPELYLTRDVGYENVRAALGAGTLTRVRTGAYIALPAKLSARDRTRQMALARAAAVHAQARGDIVLSHETAALLHGLTLWRIPSVTHVSQRANPSGRRVPEVRRHNAPVADAERTVIAGLPVTDLERTVLDCARSMHPRDALVVVDSAMRRVADADRRFPEQSKRRADQWRTRLLGVLATLGTRPGVPRARAVIEHADSLAESAPETVLRWIAVSRGLPPPTVQLRIDTRLGVYYADFGWQGDGWCAVCEFDGRVKYQQDDATLAARTVELEKAREDAIRETGAQMRRFVSRDLSAERATFARMRQMLPSSVDIRPVHQLMPAVRPSR